MKLMDRRSFFKAVGSIALAMQIGLPRMEPRKELVLYWMQTTRKAKCYSDEYLDALRSIHEATKKAIEKCGACSVDSETSRSFTRSFFFGESIENSWNRYKKP